MAILIGIISLVNISDSPYMGRRVKVSLHHVYIFRRKVAHSKALGQEMFLESKIIEKY